MTTGTDAERFNFAGASEQIREGFLRIIHQLDEHPDRARELADKTLLALAAWTDGEAHPAVTAECKRRLADHDEQRARFAAFDRD